MKSAMDKVVEYCKQTGEDINEFMAHKINSATKTDIYNLAVWDIRRKGWTAIDIRNIKNVTINNSAWFNNGESENEQKN